jgi:hypothetical protein
MITLLVLQITAHLLADFNFQPQRWCEIKDRFVISKVHFYHALVVFICSWALSFTLAFWWVALLIAVSHLLLDMLKGYLYRKNILKKQLFFIDQAMHILLICIVVIFCFSHTNFLHYIMCNYFSPLVILKGAFILLAISACAKPSNIFIKKFMEVSGIISKKEEDNTLMNAGRVIGSLERIISFALIAANQWAAVGFIIAAKTILRFRDTDTAKTEYVLIGSFLSFGIAILFGIAYQFIINNL